MSVQPKLITDNVTGYLVPEDGTGIQSKHKSGFLKAFLKSGDKSRAADSQGFTYSEFETQLELDSKFKDDYRETLLRMKHELEGMLYQNAFSKSGQKDRLLWLQQHYPEEYATKAAKGERSKSRVQTLIDGLK